MGENKTWAPGNCHKDLKHLPVAAGLLGEAVSLSPDELLPYHEQGDFSQPKDGS